jgi:sterol 24-C-methyltransferase
VKPETKNEKYKDIVTTYYDLATDFYEKGWGECFHFCKQFKNETYQEAIRRHEYYLASRLHLRDGMVCLDVGCGIGGPLRNIAKFCGAKIVGLNLNTYQVQRAKDLIAAAGLSHQCTVYQGDFMQMPFEDNLFDAAYECEATAHAPSKVGVYKEVFRVLKPGALFAGYEWVLTRNYDPNNKEHRRIKKLVEEGAGLPDIAHIDDIAPALKEAGFIDIEVKDLAPESEIPWYEPLTPKYTRTNWQITPLGVFLIRRALSCLQFFHIIPQGTTNVYEMLLKGQEGLYLGGKLKIFTPMLFHLARKPLK